MNMLGKIIYDIAVGLIIVTGVAVVVGIPAALILDKIFSNSFLNSPMSGYLLFGAFFCLVSVGFFLNKDKDNRSEEEKAREKNPFIPK